MTDFGQKILIIDDVSSVRKVLHRQLTSIGFTAVEEAKDGEEALNKIIAGDFSLVISDWEMPKLKGIELLQKIRLDARFSKLPFIMITSINNKQAVVDAAGLKVSAYLAKPFSEGTLKSIIDKLMDAG